MLREWSGLGVCVALQQEGVALVCESDGGEGGGGPGKRRAIVKFVLDSLGELQQVEPQPSLYSDHMYCLAVFWCAEQWPTLSR